MTIKRVRVATTVGCAYKVNSCASFAERRTTQRGRIANGGAHRAPKPSVLPAGAADLQALSLQAVS